MLDKCLQNCLISSGTVAAFRFTKEISSLLYSDCEGRHYRFLICRRCYFSKPNIFVHMVSCSTAAAWSASRGELFPPPPLFSFVSQVHLVSFVLMFSSVFFREGCTQVVVNDSYPGGLRQDLHGDPHQLCFCC